jgi:very-short-patch-repair endonuclease
VPDPSVTRTLETSRRELLDLSGRNRLLSLPVDSTSARLIHAIGASSDGVYRMLVDEGRALGFLPKRDDEEGEPSGGTSVDDSKLATNLSREGLERRLLTLSRDAQSIMEEQGVQILYLALGRLTWYESGTGESKAEASSDRPRHAPLLLVPVELRRTSAKASFSLRWREEDLEENLSLAAKMRGDFGIELPPLVVGDEFRPSSYCVAVAEAIGRNTRWSVEPNAITLGLFSFAKFLMYRDLDPKNWPDPDALLTNEALAALLGSESRGDAFGGGGLPYGDETDIDAVIPAERLDHVVDADGSQTLAVESVRAGHSVVIQGPPGTGKSQTITNILATAILDGKRVLFIAEKLAALEVVKRRLERIGLGPLCLELHSHKASKRSVLAELDRTWRLGTPVPSEGSGLIRRLETLRSRLNAHATGMHARLEPSGATFFAIVGALARLAEPRPLPVTCPLPQAASWEPATLEAQRDRVADLAQRAEVMGPPGDHPWRGVERPLVSAVDLPELGSLIERAAHALGALAAQLAHAHANAGVSSGQPEPQTLADSSAFGALLQRLASAPGEIDREAITNGIWSAGLSGLRELVEHGAAWTAARAELAERVTDAAFEDGAGASLSAARAAIATHGASLLRFLRGEHRSALATMRGVLRGAPPAGQDARLAILDAIIDARRHRAAIVAADGIGRQAFGALWRGEGSDWPQLAAIVAWVASESDRQRNGLMRNALRRLTNDESSDSHRLGAIATALNRAATDATQALGACVAWLALRVDIAFGSASLDRVPLALLSERLDRWRAALPRITEWSAWHVRATEAGDRGLGSIVAALDAGTLAASETRRAFELAYHTELYRAAVARWPELGRFDGIQHAQVVEEFRRVDRERLELAKHRVLERHDATMPARHAGLGATGILAAEIERRRGHRPIRRLLKDAGSVVQALKPIFMMSPLSVAQYLEPGAIDFDLLVIDEASQVQPVDAFGAFARSRQHVVVGDSRQLPPTRFFARLTGAEEETEDLDETGAPVAAGATDMESILALCSARGVHPKMLRWHYRSRHQSLIAVSNREFYEDRLFIIPSPVTRSGDTGSPESIADTGEPLGLSFRHLPSARYDRGGSGTNRAEAAAVAAAVLEHVRTTPERTLGVAAFSIRQQQAILDEIEQARKAHPELEEFHRRHEHEPFFVKNLESVQGDERDVIFISVGYGPDASGYLTMNFGPLSAEGGERRLNVLITRARRRCVVFSAIRAGDIDLARAPGRGVAAFKTFLQYAETGVLGLAERSNRPAGSPFEEAVRDALARHGLQVEGQVGVSGFFIDLAVIDPERPGRYLLGIECDGAAYHSSRSARDRDRLRQAVLEDHGWMIHRIWSTDWFQRPDAELEKVLAAIERAKLRFASQDAEASRAPVEPATIERVPEEPNAEPVASLSIPYVEATNDRPLPGELIETPTTQIAEVAALILAVEAPMHRDELIARVRSFWGLERSGARIQEAVNAAIALLISARRCEAADDFVSVPGKAVTPRDRSEVRSAALRRIDAIAPSEVQAAILAAVETYHGISESELPIAVARAFGFRTTTAAIRERVENEVRTLLAGGGLRSEAGILRILPNGDRGVG